MDRLIMAKQKLIETGACFVCISGGTTHISFERGIAPIFHLMDARKNALVAAAVADKVVGRAAALLMVHGGVKDVFALTISRHARDVFEKAGVNCAYEKEVPYIVNRKGDGMCPMEKHVLDIEDPTHAFYELRNKITVMSNQKI